MPIRLLDLPLTFDMYSLSTSPPPSPATDDGRATDGADERASVIDRESIPELAVVNRSCLPAPPAPSLDAPSPPPLPPDATEPPLPNERYWRQVQHHVQQ